MRSLKRTTLSVVLTLVPMMGVGCATSSPRVVHSRNIERREQKLNAGRLEETRGNFELAKQLYEEVHRQDSQNVECLHRLAVVCTRLNQHTAAEVYYKQANVLRPNDPELLADMGYASFMRKDYDESEKLLEQSVKLRDGDRRALTNLAIVRAWQKKDESSLATFRRVCGEAEAMRCLAAIQIARGERDLGVKSYELAKATESRKPETANQVTQLTANTVPEPVVDAPLPPPSPLPVAQVARQPEVASPQTQAASNVQFPVITPYASTPIQLSSSTQSPALLPATQAPACNRTAMPDASRDAPLPPQSPLDYPTSTKPNAPATYEAQKETEVKLEADVTANVSNPSTVLKSAQVSDPEEPKAAEVTTVTQTPTLVALDSSVVPPAPEDWVDPQSLEFRSVTSPEEYQVVDQEELELDAIMQLPANVPVQTEVKQKPATELKTDVNSPTVWRKSTSIRQIKSETAPAVRNAPSVTHNESPAPQSVAKADADDAKPIVWNICLVTLFEEKRLSPAQPQFETEYRSQQYRFCSAEALERFKAAPQRYAPAAGGVDLVCMCDRQCSQQGSLNFALWYRRQLYLFSSSENAERFRKDPQKFIVEVE